MDQWDDVFDDADDGRADVAPGLLPVEARQPIYDAGYR
jgi:hypothetical protein